MTYRLIKYSLMRYRLTKRTYKEKTHMRDLRFLQWCWWRSTSSGMLQRHGVTTQTTWTFNSQVADAPRSVLWRLVVGFPSSLRVVPSRYDVEGTHSVTHLLYCKPVPETNTNYYSNRWYRYFATILTQNHTFSTTLTSCNSCSFAVSGSFNSFQFATFLFYNFSAPF